MKANSRSTYVTRFIKAPRSRVYQALIDADQVAQWKFPDGMTCKVHSFEGKEGGTFRISLTYTDANRNGKTVSHTDTYHGRFIKLVPDELLIEEDEFETGDPSLQGIMTIKINLRDADGGTEISGLHENLPPGVSLADNEKGWQLAFEKLAALLEVKKS